MTPLLNRETTGPMRREEFRCVLRERLLAHRAKILLRVAVAPDFDRPMAFTGGEMVERAEQLAGALNLPRESSVVLLLLPHSPELFLLQLGLVLRGHIPAVLAWPTARVDREKYQRNLVHQLSQLPADHLLTLAGLAANLTPGLPYPVSAVPLANESALAKPFPGAAVSEKLIAREFPERKAQPGSEALFLQFSGGTTGAQKAVVVTTGMLLQQFEQLGRALQFSSADEVVSWLPLYHDMGLVACYWMPLWGGASSTQIAANDWIINPELLLKYIARYRATFCWLPNFAFSYLAQRRELMRETHSLDSMRAWINCSEPVRRKSLDEFAEAFAGWGVRPEHLQSSYAMAETVFAITQSQLGEELVNFARSNLRKNTAGHGELAFDLIDAVYVSSGKPLAHTEVKIVAPDGSPCREETAGEIHVRTPALFSGYWGANGLQTHSLQDGWHATGDYGFVASGELFVIGRYKDMVIVGGNNILPEDVEAVVNTIPGVYAGRVVAFGVDDQEYGTQSLAVVAEMKEDFSDHAAAEIETLIRKLVLTAIGTAPRYVAVVPSPWIVKSTAGKISRRETRERFVRERLAAAHTEVNGVDSRA